LKRLRLSSGTALVDQRPQGLEFRITHLALVPQPLQPALPNHAQAGILPA